MRNDISGSFALDTQALGELRYQAKKDSPEALKAAAQQFEAVFLNMMMKSMREAAPVESMFDSEQSKMFISMLDQQMSQTMASRGVGLADMLVKQLSGGQPNSEGLPANIVPSSAPRQVHYLASSPAATVQPQTAQVSKALAATPRAFVEEMLPHAQAASRKTGVPVELMMGQAALETGWGKSQIKMVDGQPSYNLFGIKATGWSGKVAEVMTTEYRNGIANKQSERFRAYESYTQSFEDYARLISSNPRYKDALQQQGDIQGMANAIQRGGYATDPRYADKLVRVMEMLNLGG